MLTPEERIQVCSTCLNRKFNPEVGIVCGKTGNKPEFANACHDYQADQAAVDRQRLKEENSEPEIEGFLAFFVYWIIPIGLVLSILSLIIQWDTISACGPMMIAFEIAFYAFYTYFQIYTIYGFVKRKPDTVFIAKYQLIVLVAVNLLVVFSGVVDESNILENTPRLCVSIAWSVVSFIYLCLSKHVEDLIPKKTRKLAGLNKIMFILSLVIPFLLYVGALISIVKGALPENTIITFCEKQNKSLPAQTAEGLNLDNMSVNDGMVIYSYQYTGMSNEDLGLADSDVASFNCDFQKEIAKDNFQNISINDDPLAPYIVKANYGIGMNYYDCNDTFAYGFSFTPEEFSSMLEDDYVYHTSDEFYEELFDYYSSITPCVYFEGAILYDVKLSSDGKSMEYDLTLTGIPRSSLIEMNSAYVKDYMLEDILPYFTDPSLLIASLNGLNLSYHFSADNFDTYAASFTIKPEEYNQIQTAEE